MDRGAWWATVHRITKDLGHDLATKQQQSGSTDLKGKFKIEKVYSFMRKHLS